MLSAAPMRFAATHGSMEGTYSLKLNTKPVANRYEEKPANGSIGVALKRLSNFDPTMRFIQMEAWWPTT